MQSYKIICILAPLPVNTLLRGQLFARQSRHMLLMGRVAMASRMLVDRIALKTLQHYHHATLNTFGEHETLVDAVANRPGIFGANPVAYLSLMARRPFLHVGDVDEALLNDRTLVRVTAFRGILFLLASADYPNYFRALFATLKNMGMEKLQAAGIGQAQLDHLVHMARQIETETPLSHEQLISQLYPAPRKRPEAGTQRLVVRKLCDLGVFIRANWKGWKGNDFSFIPSSKWLLDLPLAPDNPESARTETVRRYLRSYGPATMEDIAWWTGIPLAQVLRSVSHLRREAVRMPVEGYKEDLVGLRETVDSLRRPPTEFSEIQLFPQWDAYLLGWQNRKRLVEKEFAAWVYDPQGNVVSTILDRGKVIGIWQFRDSRINVLEFHVFGPYQAKRKEVFRKAEEHAAQLAQMSGTHAVNIFERPLPESLNNRPAGAFLWPLGKELPFHSTDKGLLDSPLERRTSNTFRGSYLDHELVVRSPDVRPSEQEMDEASYG